MIRFALYLTLFITSCGLPSSAQTVQELITSVQNAQAHLQNITYSIIRTDTLVDGTIRRMTGHALIQPDSSEPVFGYRFRGKKDGMPGDLIFDGHIAYETNEETKTYTLTINPGQIKTLLNGSGTPDRPRCGSARYKPGNPVQSDQG